MFRAFLGLKEAKDVTQGFTETVEETQDEK
jgi:hypothetical protein